MLRQLADEPMPTPERPNNGLLPEDRDRELRGTPLQGALPS